MTSLVRLEPFSKAEANEADTSFMSWTKVAALGLGVEERLGYGAYAAYLVLLIDVLVHVWALAGDDPIPLSVAVCQTDFRGAFAALSVIVAIGSGAVLACATIKNVYGWGILFGFLSPLSAIVPLLATVCRTVAYIRLYTSFSADASCNLWTIAASISHLCVLANLVLSDVFLRRAPRMRLACALHITLNLAVSIYLTPGSEAGGYYNTTGINATGIAFIDENLQYLLSGASADSGDAQAFILACDQTVLFLTLPSMVTTIMRPQALAFTTLPCQLDTMTFFYDRESRERNLNGKMRYDRLARDLAWNVAKLRRCEWAALVETYTRRTKDLATKFVQPLVGDPLRDSDVGRDTDRDDDGRLKSSKYLYWPYAARPSSSTPAHSPDATSASAS